MVATFVGDGRNTHQLIVDQRHKFAKKFNFNDRLVVLRYNQFFLVSGHRFLLQSLDDLLFLFFFLHLRLCDQLNEHVR